MQGKRMGKHQWLLDCMSFSCHTLHIFCYFDCKRIGWITLWWLLLLHNIYPKLLTIFTIDSVYPVCLLRQVLLLGDIFLFMFHCQLSVIYLLLIISSGVLLQRQILKRQLSRQMFFRKLLIFSLLFLLSNLKYISNKCFWDKM